MRLFLLLLFLIAGTALHAQYNTEFGLDMIWVMVPLTGNSLESTNIELLYKEDTGKKDLRFKLTYAAAFQEYEFVKQVRLDSSSIFSYHVPQQSWAFDIGLAPHILVKGQPFYYGADVQLAFRKGSIKATPEACDPIDADPLCDILRSVDNTNYSVGVIPFLGTKLKLTDRLLFTIEFGTQFNYRIGSHQYLTADNTWKESSINGIEFQLNKWINDLALSYRF